MTLPLLTLVMIMCQATTATDPPASPPPTCTIRPDYQNVVIPANIAPLNFTIENPATRYRVCLKGTDNQSPLTLTSKSCEIQFPTESWRTLLQNHQGQSLQMTLEACNSEGIWQTFAPITLQVSNDEIDPYLVYRSMYPGHSTWRDIEIRQRCLTNFDETCVLHNKAFKSGCMNCHSFSSTDPMHMILAIRSMAYGSSTLLIEGKQAVKLGTKSGYASWHPSGRLVAYSLNKVRQFFHSASMEVRDVLDLDSSLAYYHLDKDEVKTVPALSQRDRLETYPCWAPDGKSLYFSTAAIPWSDRDTVPPPTYNQVKYELARIAYDPDTDQWGEVEIVLPKSITGGSALEPRISPDGRWLLFCLCDYGCFPVFRPNSDLYLIDLHATDEAAFKPRRLECNSEVSESWHSWSSNSRWFVFSSKREYGLYTKPYLCHIDENGQVSKPLVLPQENPGAYDCMVTAFNTPELTRYPVQVTGNKLGRVLRGPSSKDIPMPVTGATPASDPTPEPHQ